MPEYFEWLKTMFGQIFRISLLGKIVIALILVGLLPLILASAQLLSLNRRAFADHVLRLHAVTARTVASQIDAQVSARHSLVQAAAQNPMLSIDPQSSVSQEVLMGLLTAEGTLGALSAGMFNGDGEEIIRAQRRNLDHGASALLSAECDMGSSLVDSDGHKWMIIKTPMPDSDAEFRALFEGDSLRQYLLPDELGESASISLVDRDGQTVIQPGSEPRVIPVGLVDHAKSGHISGAGKFEDTFGAQVLGAFAPLQRAPWSVVSWQPLQVAEAIERSMKTRALIAVLLALALTAGLSAWAFFTVIRPLRGLVADHQKLVGRPTSSEGKDEIAQLRSAFEALERHITESKALDEVFLGRYQVIQRVGSGAMGTVFRGWDPKLKRPVALKTIRFDETKSRKGSPQVTSQLLHEAISVARISHENVIGVYDVGDSEEFGFVAMEYIDGITLNAYLGEDRVLEEKEILQLALAIARGLSAAHARNIVHRDIKPANVLLGHEGQIKIADFGISLLMSSLAGDAERIFGTPGFLPPETLSGKGFSPLGDLFALGVLLYRCATGVRPFGGENDRRVFINTLMENPDPARSLNHDISNELNDIIMSLLEKDPSMRIQSTEKLIEMLERLVDDPKWVFAPVEEEWADEETHSIAPSKLVDPLDFAMECNRGND